MTEHRDFIRWGVFVKSVLARVRQGYLKGPTDIVLSKKNPGIFVGTGHGL